MKKAIVIISVAVASFLAGWILMAPSLEYFGKYQNMNTLISGKKMVRNGSWMTRLDLAQSNTPPLIRAYIARIGLAANQAKEALYWNTYNDNRNRLLDGSHSYNVHFKERPAIQDTGFWSLTVYNKDSYLVPNNEKRYALGDRSPITKSPDGSFNIHISSRKPDDANNWLPCPSSGVFSLTLRMYVPSEEALKHAESISMPEISCLDCP
ncbi:MAG: DUF1214 domain-containing protein [Syntrophales bacterium]